MQSCNYSDEAARAGLNCSQESVFFSRTLPATLKYVGKQFYIVGNDEAYPETIDKVPELEAAAVPFMVVTIILEYIVLKYKGKKPHAIGDGIGSISTGMMKDLVRMVSKGLQHSAYLWVHRNFCIYDLPWDSPYTWYLAAILADLAYYWGHRAAHELNVLWAHHQAHHNSDFFNCFVAMRQGPLQLYFLWLFLIPTAMFIPPTQYLLHIQLNLLATFWVHTEAIDTLGPLEYILNTPSHHRVHHGSNPYCIDKNYGGILIIWDRIFGTFEAERKDEKVIYGLVHQMNSANPIFLVFNHFPVIWNNFWSIKGFRNKMRVLFYGPNWEPGSPRMGNYDTIPPADPERVPFTAHTSRSRTAYIVLHFILILLGHQCLSRQESILSTVDTWLYLFYFVYSLYCMGQIFENQPSAPYYEFLRCAVFLACTTTEVSLLSSMGESLLTREDMYCVLRVIFTVSAAVWGCTSLYQIVGLGSHAKQKKA